MCVGRGRTTTFGADGEIKLINNLFLRAYNANRAGFVTGFPMRRAGNVFSLYSGTVRVLVCLFI